MKIYFCGSVSGNRTHTDFYYKFMDHLKKYGDVLTEGPIKGGDRLTGPPDPEKCVLIYKRDIAWLRESDVVIADVTIHSLGVGYELGLAESLGKRILCLYKGDSPHGLSPMLSGNKGLPIKTYNTVEEAIDAIDGFIGRTPKH